MLQHWKQCCGVTTTKSNNIKPSSEICFVGFIFVNEKRTIALLNALHWVSKSFTNYPAIRLILVLSIIDWELEPSGKRSKATEPKRGHDTAESSVVRQKLMQLIFGGGSIHDLQLNKKAKLVGCLLYHI